MGETSAADSGGKVGQSRFGKTVNLVCRNSYPVSFGRVFDTEAFLEG